jgi:hypothetical protein
MAVRPRLLLLEWEVPRLIVEWDVKGLVQTPGIAPGTADWRSAALLTTPRLQKIGAHGASCTRMPPKAAERFKLPVSAVSPRGQTVVVFYSLRNWSRPGDLHSQGSPLLRRVSLLDSR